jgi:hypothetical protein
MKKNILWTVGLLVLVALVFGGEHVSREQATDDQFFTSFGITSTDPAAQSVVDYELEILMNSARTGVAKHFSNHDLTYREVSVAAEIILRRQVELAEKRGKKIPEEVEKYLHGD